MVFAAWLGVTAVTAAVTVVLYARDLSKPQADFTLAVFALLAAVSAFTMACSAWARRKNLKKIDKADKAAAGPGGANGGPEMTVSDVGAPAWAVGTPFPPAVAGGFPLPADVRRAEPSPWRRRIVPLTATAASVVAVVAVTAIVLGSSSAHKPATTERTSQPAPVVEFPELTIDQLRPGDCLQGPPDIITASSWPALVTAVPCGDKHLAEVVFFSAHYWPLGMAFPGHAKIAHQSNAECRKAFQAYDGAPLAASEYSYLSTSPSHRAYWDSGDRLLLCTAYVWDSQYSRGVPLWSSIKGTHS